MLDNPTTIRCLHFFRGSQPALLLQSQNFVQVVLAVLDRVQIQQRLIKIRFILLVIVNSGTTRIEEDLADLAKLSCAMYSAKLAILFSKSLSLFFQINLNLQPKLLAQTLKLNHTDPGANFATDHAGNVGVKAGVGDQRPVGLEREGGVHSVLFFRAGVLVTGVADFISIEG